MNKSIIKINAKKIFAGIIVIILVGFALYAVIKAPKENDELLTRKKEMTLNNMVRDQYNFMMFSISSFTKTNDFYMTPDKILEKAEIQCSPMLYKILSSDSFDKYNLKDPNSTLYKPTYDCISKQIEPLPVSEKIFIKFVNAPRFEQYKNVPEVKKVIEIASQDSALTMGEALTIIKTIDQAENRIAVDKFKNN